LNGVLQQENSKSQNTFWQIVWTTLDINLVRWDLIQAYVRTSGSTVRLNLFRILYSETRNNAIPIQTL
jgi:hypothetical protein